AMPLVGVTTWKKAPFCTGTEMLAVIPIEPHPGTPTVPWSIEIDDDVLAKEIFSVPPIVNPPRTIGPDGACSTSVPVIAAAAGALASVSEAWATCSETPKNENVP